jgi:hypothetical protein
MTFLLPRVIKLTPVIFLLIFTGCRSGSNDDGKYAPGTKEGYELAKYHCSTCHSFPPAELLDKNTWKKGVLPPMGSRLGLQILWNSEYIESASENGGVIHLKEWNKILAYYLKTAPEKLTIPAPDVPVILDSAIFSLKVPAYRAANPVRTVFTSFDTATGNVYTSDFLSQKLYKWNHKLEAIDSIQLASPILYANYFTDSAKKHHAWFTDVGYMKPSNMMIGEILDVDLTKPLQSSHTTIAEKLARPIYSTTGDLNNDGLIDIVVCEFGYSTTGGISIIKQLPGNKFEKTRLISASGATQAIIKDFDNDGWNDIMTLFAHDDESIRVFINDKNGGFKQKLIMQFPPVYGSSSFQLADFNKDGIDDILYSCGDNADVSPVYKPYHGIYIFLGKGNFEYERKYFYQINGCTKAVATDFDNDGDLDIATIAVYADFNNKPEQGFLYFEHTGNLNFKTYSPGLYKIGKWTAMDVNDYDRDGDQDIILGNFPRNSAIEKPFESSNWQERLPFVVLENKTK